uniref:DUF11 domain-containing protein n=1 Tax=uncultured Tenacibaculum sp. TaxID=174713 RepID=UPI002610507A
ATVNAPTGAADEYKNEAQITGSDQFDPNSTPNNDDGDQSEDDEANFTVAPQQANVSLAKSFTDVNGGNVEVGDTLTFTVAVSNVGDTATGVAVADVLPAGYSLVSGSIDNGGVYNAGATTINWTGLSIANGITLNLTYQVTVNAPTGATDEYKNVVEVTAADQFDPNSSPNNDNGDQSEDDEDAATVTVAQANLSLAKSASVSNPNVGDVVTYTVTVSNAGPNDATGVTVEDIVPNGLQIVNAGTATQTGNVLTWSGLTVANGGTTVVTYTAEVLAPGTGVSYDNVAEITAADQFDPNSAPDNDDGDQSEDDEVLESITPQTADLSLVKSVSNSTPNVGDVVTFTLLVANAGA